MLRRASQDDGIVLRAISVSMSHPNKENIRMKQIIQASMLCALASISLIACAEPVCQKKSGETMCGKGEVDILGVNGIFKATQTKFKKRLVVRGQAIMDDCEVNEIKVYGQALLTKSKVFGKALVYGHVELMHAQFKQPLVAHTNQLLATGSSFANLIISPTQAGCKVELREGSSVNGDIVFRGYPGTVILSDGARITGKIINGKQQ